MSFAVIPFILLRLDVTMKAWSHVYYYGIINVVVAQIAFLSPAKGWLVGALNKRNAADQGKQQQHQHQQQEKEQEQKQKPEGLQEPPVLGMPTDVISDLDEAVRELSSEPHVSGRLKENVDSAMSSARDGGEEKLGKRR